MTCCSRGSLRLVQNPASYPTMKHTLAHAAAGNNCDQIATWCIEHPSTTDDVALLLYDATTLYFEEQEDELRKVGYS